MSEDGDAGVRWMLYSPPASCASCDGIGTRCGVSVVEMVTRRLSPAATVTRVGNTWIWYSSIAPGTTGCAEAWV